MSAMKKYLPLFASAALMCMVLLFIYPHYQYYVDPDGTAYLTISQRYANGDYQTAVNGYWSPWACWLTALLMIGGMAAIPASVVINSLGALCFLFTSHSLFFKFKIIIKLQWILNITLALFLCYAIFWQSFDDLWECFFLLAALRLMLIEQFKTKPFLWVIYGVTGTFAYFAKAYSFPFFILNTVSCVYFICGGNKGQWLKISFASLATMLLCSLPWIVALHTKYGIWTTSTAGTLNTSWYLIGQPRWKEGIDLLIPPAYKDSPYYWEDPWLANGPTPHFWNSWRLFGMQILRLGYNILKLLRSMFQLSVFFPVITVVLISFVSNKKARVTTAPTFTVALSFILFPLGYLLVNFESRYLWYMVPLCMLAGGLYIQQMEDKPLKKILPYIFALTFLLYPALEMLYTYDEGHNDYVTAIQLKKMGVRGSFTVFPFRGKDPWPNQRVAYFSGLQFYKIPNPDSCSFNGVLNEMNRHHVNYLIRPGNYDHLRLPDGSTVLNMNNGKIEGISIFLVNPQ
jgi:general stress protein CsbA